MNRVITAFAHNLAARQMTVPNKVLNAALDGPLGFAALAHQRLQPRPAMALVVPAVGEREQDNLLAVGQLKLPHQGHDANAHRSISRVIRSSRVASRALTSAFAAPFISCSARRRRLRRLRSSI